VNSRIDTDENPTIAELGWGTPVPPDPVSCPPEFPKAAPSLPS